MKYRFDLKDSTGVVTDEGPWFDSALQALDAEVEELDKQIKPWLKEAAEALQRNDPYYGGAVLQLAELLRRKSFAMSRRPMHRTNKP